MPTVRRAECNKRRIAFLQAASQPFVKITASAGDEIYDLSRLDDLRPRSGFSRTIDATSVIAAECDLE